jgi:hypothetical protein
MMFIVRENLVKAAVCGHGDTKQSFLKDKHMKKFVAALVILTSTACNSAKTDAVSTTTASTLTTVPTVAPVATETPADKIAKMTTLREVIEFAKPFMSDEVSKPSVGTVALSIWGVKRMKFSDVVVVTDETSYARVQKDPDSERGKRLCITGKLVEITVSKTDFGKVFEGLLYNGNLWRFAAMGSTGDLVEMKPARFCGVVIGKYDYSNSAGGTGHAVQVVGMFDLPENKSQ